MAFVFLLNNLVAMIINISIFSSRYVHKWQFPDLYFLKRELRVAFPFVFISMFYILDNRLDTIVLSFLSTEKEIGIYGAATAVILALTMIPQGYRISILPILSRSHQDEPEHIQRLYTQSLKYLLLIAFPLFFATVILAGKLIQLLYRQPLPEAIPVLQILAISLVFTFINALNTQLLVTFNQQGSTARFLVFTSSMNLILNLLLAAQLGAIGAAIARVLSIFALYVLTSLILRKFTHGFNSLSYVWRPIISATIMGAVIWYLDPWGLILQIIVGSLTYLILLLTLGTFTPTEKALFQNALKQKFR
jgi:O-antigen/teichoic acid export membrane protein